jgi:serine/threonine protein kinase
MPLSNWFRRTSTTAALKPSGGRVATKACSACRIELPDAARFCYLCGRAIETTAASPYGGGDDAVVAALRERLVVALAKRYEVRGIIGKGGMGIVFLAEDRKSGTQVAVKVMRPEVSVDEVGVSRFRREAQIAASLEHPGIIPILQVGSDQGLHYFVMQYVAGHSLDALLEERRAEKRPLPIGAATRILDEAATTLGFAHERGVVHRDVKPANIMLDNDGRVLLTDFGISKNATVVSGATTVARLTDTGTVLGTPQYLAPEQALGTSVDGRADQYALAIVGFEMLAGYVPFDDETPHAIIHRHINDAPPSLTTVRPDVPQHVASAIARALSKAPSRRFATMDEFARALAGETTDSGGAARQRVLARRILTVVILGALAAALWLGVPHLR